MVNIKPGSNMFRINSNRLLKFILIVLFAINIVLIVLQLSRVINLNISVRKVFTPTGISLVIENLFNDDRANFNIADMAEQRSNIALNYYNEWKNYSTSNAWKGKGIKTCDTRLPSIEEIDFNNIFWQTIPNTNKIEFFLYNAYYDNRGTDKYVRIVSVQRNPKPRDFWSVILFKI